MVATPLLLEPGTNQIKTLLKQRMRTPITSLHIIHKDTAHGHLLVVRHLRVKVASTRVKGGLDRLQRGRLGRDVVQAKAAKKVAHAVDVRLGRPEPGRRHARHEAGAKQDIVPVDDAAEDGPAALGAVDEDVAGEQVGVDEREAARLVRLVKVAAPGQLVHDAAANVERLAVEVLGVLAVQVVGEAAGKGIVEHLEGVEVGVLVNGRDAHAGGGDLGEGATHLVGGGHAERPNGNQRVVVVEVRVLAAGVDEAGARPGDVAVVFEPVAQRIGEIKPLLLREVEEALLEGLTSTPIHDHVGRVNGIVLGLIKGIDLGRLGAGGIGLQPLQNADLAAEDKAVVLVSALEGVELDGVAQDKAVLLAIGVGHVNCKAAIDRDSHNTNQSLVVLDIGPELLAKLLVVFFSLCKAPLLRERVTRGRNRRHDDFESLSSWVRMFLCELGV